MAEHIRLLRCDDCRTMEPLPDYEGPHDRDHVLIALIDYKHTEPSGNKHRGQLMRLEKRDWDSPSRREAILEKLKEELGGSTGFSPEFYEARNTFMEDAGLCFRKHNRNPNCGDYQSDKMRLTPGTAKERKEAGLPKYRSDRDVYLCHYCPVQAIVNNTRWEKAQKN